MSVFPLSRCACRVQFYFAAADWQTLESSARELGPLLLQDEAKFNECVQPLQATMMPLQDPLLFLTMSSSFWGKFWDTLYKSEHAAVDAVQPLIKPLDIFKALRSAGGLPAANSIAYVSSNFQGGAVWYMIQGLLADHLRLNSSHVSAYSTAPIDPKGPSISVLQRVPLLDASNMRHTDTVMSIRRAAPLVAIDINGFTEKPALQIFRFRVAPVQMTWMGYPGSLHLENMDYLVADATAVPVEHVWAMKEKLVFLSQTYYVNDMRAQLPAVGLTPPLTRHVDAMRLAHNLPIQLPGSGRWSDSRRPIILMCFNRLIKIDRVIFSFWMAAMRAQPRTLLWLLNEAKSEVECSPLHFEIFVFIREFQVAMSNLKLQAGSMGVDPARLIFAPFVSWQQNVERGFAADLFLDTPMYEKFSDIFLRVFAQSCELTTCRYNAHSTGVNALWASVPILSLPDQVRCIFFCLSQLLADIYF